jgi:hypothetical protein
MTKKVKRGHEEHRMSDRIRASKIVRATAGRPNVPDPHPADYSTRISNDTLALIDEACPQDVLSGGKVLKRFEW